MVTGYGALHLSGRAALILVEKMMGHTLKVRSTVTLNPYNVNDLR